MPLVYDRDIYNLQIVLNKAGYSAGSVDGLRGNDTNGAIGRYMQAQGIEGDPATTDARALFQRAGRAYADQLLAQPSMSASDTIALQMVLNGLGYNSGRPDGVRGDVTNRAINAFRQANPVPGAYVPAPQQAAPQVPQRPEAVPQQDGVDPVLRVRSLVAISSQLGREQIRDLQGRLNSLGMDAGAENGQMTRQTRAAMARFDRQFGNEDPSVRQAVWTRPAGENAALRISFGGAARSATVEQHVRDTLSLGIQQFAESAVSRRVRYDFEADFNKPANAQALNCSAFVMHAGAAGLSQLSTLRLTGQDQIAAVGVRPGTQEGLRTFAANQIEILGRRHGVTQIGGLQDLRAGMVIGMDHGDRGWDAGRARGIDHIVMTFQDQRTGTLMVAQSQQGQGATITPADEWMRANRGRPLFAVDLARAAVTSVTADPTRSPVQVAAALPEPVAPALRQEAPAGP